MRLPVLTVLASAAALAACTAPAEENMAGNEVSEAVIPPENEAVPEPSVVPPADNAVTEPIKAEPGSAENSSRPFQPLPEDDQCKSAEYQWLVGQPRSKIPETPDGAKWRVACTGCPITMDYSPARMNIFYDEKTGLIEQVKCG